MMKEKILIADDEEPVRRVIQRALALYPYEIVNARNGIEALQIASEAAPRLIFLDIGMPGKNGWSVLRELRASAKNRLTPVIMLTGAGAILDKVVGFTLGADDYITKPFDTEELVVRMKGILRRTSREFSAEPARDRPEAPDRSGSGPEEP